MSSMPKTPAKGDDNLHIEMREVMRISSKEFAPGQELITYSCSLMLENGARLDRELPITGLLDESQTRRLMAAALTVIEWGQRESTVEEIILKVARRILEARCG